MAELKLVHVYKIYDQTGTVVTDINLHVKDKEFIVLVGPSGCGKSTTLRMIAGLEKISQGNLYIDEKKANDVPTKDRGIAMVFQNYALYPHLSVYDNIAFSLRLHKLPKNEIDRRVKEAANMLGITAYLKRKPKALSGGQRQRVALGRAIARDAKVFLMDEPLSNLDAQLRVQTRTELIKLHRRLQTTIIYVTHDQTEAMTMATRLVVMKDGKIQQVGVPKDVYEKPENVFVGSFIGSPPMNFLNGKLEEGKFIIGSTHVAVPEGKMSMLREQGYVGKEVIFGIRPEHIQHKSVVTDAAKDSIIHTKIDVCEFTGAETIIYFQIEGQNFAARAHSHISISSGQMCELTFDMDKAHFFDPYTELRIRFNHEECYDDDMNYVSNDD